MCDEDQSWTRANCSENRGFRWQIWYIRCMNFNLCSYYIYKPKTSALSFRSRPQTAHTLIKVLCAYCLCEERVYGFALPGNIKFQYDITFVLFDPICQFFETVISKCMLTSGNWWHSPGNFSYPFSGFNFVFTLLCFVLGCNIVFVNRISITLHCGEHRIVRSLSYT